MGSSLNADSKTPSQSSWLYAHRKLLLRVAISAVLLAFVYSFVNFPALLNTLKIVSPWTAALLVVLYALGQLISAFKWRVFIASAGLQRPIGSTIRAYFLGMFANTFGLGTVGGDVSRGLLLRPEPGKRAAALATVVADRAHGLGTLIALGAASIIFVRPEVLEPWALPMAALVLPAMIIGWWWGPKLLTKLIPENHRFGSAVRNAANAFPRSFSKFGTATAISLFFHSLQIFMHYLIALELGAELSLPYLFAVVPLVNVASSLPISVQGLGVREAMYMFVFLPVGVSEEQAVAFGAIWILAVTVVSALSGPLAGASFGANEKTAAAEHEPSASC